MKNVIQTVEIARTAMNITWCDFQQISGNKLAVILIYAPFENTA